MSTATITSMSIRMGTAIITMSIILTTATLIRRTRTLIPTTTLTTRRLRFLR
jgi:hypothetical protein